MTFSFRINPLRIEYFQIELPPALAGGKIE